MRSSRSGTIDAKGGRATRFGDSQDDGPANEPESKEARLGHTTAEADTETGEREGEGAWLRTTSPSDPENGLSPALEPPEGFTAVTARPDSTCSVDLNEGHVHCTPALTS